MHRSTIQIKCGEEHAIDLQGSSVSTLLTIVEWGRGKENSGVLNKFFDKNQAIDLDLSVGMFKDNGGVFDMVYFHKMVSSDQAIAHHEDHLPDHLSSILPLPKADYETVEVRLSKIDPSVHAVFLFLNSYKAQDFANVPSLSVKVCGVNSQAQLLSIAGFQYQRGDQLKGKQSLIIGKIIRSSEKTWKLTAMCEPLDVEGVDETIESIKGKYLS